MWKRQDTGRTGLLQGRFELLVRNLRFQRALMVWSRKDKSLMSLLPLFPLPNVVLFPGALLPLHIFEPRYRAMVADALASDRRIGMVLLRPGFERDYDGRPPIHAVGCSGVIIHDARLVDGRYNIVLRGLERFRVISEDHERAYRRATTTVIDEPPQDDVTIDAVRSLRFRLADRLGVPLDAAGQEDSAEAEQLAALPDADFVHTIAHLLDLEPIEKQALLECDTLRRRAEALIELLDMKRLAATMPAGRDVTH
jgi:Lon protease-like protein